MQENYCVGFGSFHQNKPSKLLKELLSPDVVETLEEQQEWWICHGDYNDQHWADIFRKMKESKAYKVQLGRNLNQRMIKQISGVTFLCLKALCFGKNKIENIEAISTIKAPQLEWLSFEENYITSLRPLRKAFFPKLKIINLKYNKIKEIDLRQFRAPNLIKICLEFHYEQPKQVENLTWLFTLQTKNMKILRCRSDKRIKNKLLDQQLKSKYRELQLKKYAPELVNDSESESDKQ